MVRLIVCIDKPKINLLRGFLYSLEILLAYIFSFRHPVEQGTFLKEVFSTYFD